MHYSHSRVTLQGGNCLIYMYFVVKCNQYMKVKIEEHPIQVDN